MWLSMIVVRRISVIVESMKRLDSCLCLSACNVECNFVYVPMVVWSWPIHASRCVKGHINMSSL